MGSMDLSASPRVRGMTFNWRKILLIISLNWISFLYGFTHGHVTGLVAALQKGDGGVALSEGEISLIAAFINFSFIFGFLYAAVFGEKVGRRWCYIFCSVPSVMNWLILYYANDMATFMMSRFLAGVAVGAMSVLNTGVAAEFTTQKSRALHLSMLTILSPGFGVGAGHALGVFFHWRSLALCAIFMSASQLFLPYFWVESPQWLAMKGRFEECEAAFRQLHGNDVGLEHELVLLVKMERSKRRAAEEINTKHPLRKLLMAVRKRYFWDLMLMAVFVYVYYTAAGKMVFMSLATVVLQEMTGASDVFLYTLLVDAFGLVGTVISCVFIKRMTIRRMLFSSGLVAIGILLVLSACLYFKNTALYFQWINVTLLAVYFVVIYAGPYPVMEILLGEMFPLDLKLHFFVLTSPIIICTIFLSVLLMPFLIGVMGYHGLFLLNSLVMLVCLTYLYAKLPETRGKTLQEIEVYFKTKNYDVDAILSDDEHIKDLI